MADRRPPRREGNHPRRNERPDGLPRTPAALPSAEETPAKLERLQKVLAHAGIGSRRGCEELILQGRVTVNGKEVRELGTKVDPRAAKISVDGQPIHLERPVYFAVFKPRGYVATNADPAGRPRVVDLLPEIAERVYTVGRLDESSTGLMILTNDGELANRLTHPRYGVEKVYRVIVAGIPTRETLVKLTEGVWLAEGKVRAKHVRAVARKGEATVLEMVLAEGKNREVRRILARFGHKVMSLVRVAIGPIALKGLKPGEFRPLSGREVDLLRRTADGLSVPQSRPRRRPARPPDQAASKRPAAAPPSGSGPKPVIQGAPSGGPRRRPAGPAQPQRRAALPRRTSTPSPNKQPRRHVIGLQDETAGTTSSHVRGRRPPARPRPLGGPPRPSLTPRSPLPRRRRPDEGRPTRDAAEPENE